MRLEKTLYPEGPYIFNPWGYQVKNHGRVLLLEDLSKTLCTNF